MKQNITTFKTSLLLAGSLALAASCQDYEPFSEQQVQDRAYTREFERQFGEIDPNQNWDLFGQLARHIGPVTRAGEDEWSIAWTTDQVKIDVKKRDNFKLVLPEDGGARAVGSSKDKLRLEQTNLGQVTQNFLFTAHTIRMAPVYWQTSGPDEIGIYWYTDPSDPLADCRIVDGHTYFLRYQTIIATNEFKQHLHTAQGSGNVISGEPSATTLGENDYWYGDVLEVHIPSSISSYGFYVTNHGYDQEGVPNTRYSESKFNEPVYIEGVIDLKDPCYVATFNLKDLGLDDDDDQQYLCFEDWMHGDSNFDMNDLVLGIEEFEPTSIVDHDADNERAILVCEDLNDYDFDFNDIVLGLHYQETYDFEWVEQSDGTKFKDIDEDSRKGQLNVIAMAAGGAFESTVAFDVEDNNNGEWGKIHVLMSEENGAQKGARGHEIINAEEETYPGDGETTSFGDDKLPTKNVGEGESQYPTYLSQLFATDFFKIYCTQGRNNGNEAAVTLLKNGTHVYTDYVDHDIDNGPVPASAPQMILLPWYFEWPREKVWIQDAYEGFMKWVQDASETTWILDSQQKALIVDRGDFENDPNVSGSVKPEGITATHELTVTQPVEFTYDENTTYQYGAFIPLNKDDYIINEGAVATLKIKFLYKQSGTLYFNDANGVQLFRINSDDHNNVVGTTVHNYAGKSGYDWLVSPNGPLDEFEPIEMEIPLKNELLTRALETGGIWILPQKNSQKEDMIFIIDEVALLTIEGEATEESVHNLTVDPTSLTFSLSDTEGQTITATCTTITDLSTITFVSSDESVATVSAATVSGTETVTVTVTPVAEGTATITVTAPADDNRGKRTRTVKVTVGEASSGSSETNLTVTEAGTNGWGDIKYTLTGSASALKVGATLAFEIEGNGNNHKADCYTADNQGGTRLINNDSSVTLTKEQIEAISVSNDKFTLYAITWNGETLKSATITPNN